jgi:hypothetical protein
MNEMTMAGIISYMEQGAPLVEAIGLVAQWYGNLHKWLSGGAVMVASANVKIEKMR